MLLQIRQVIIFLSFIFIIESIYCHDNIGILYLFTQIMNKIFRIELLFDPPMTDYDDKLSLDHQKVKVYVVIATTF